MKTCRAFILDGDKSHPLSDIRHVEEEHLGKGDVLVSVLYSSLNYKDALAITGRGKIIRRDLPFIPGIDLVGTVVESDWYEWSRGDAVIATGWGIGEEHPGGYSQLQRLRHEWLVPAPGGLSPYECMTAGTAGLTAMLAVMSLEWAQITPTAGEVVVTGASGGLGMLAVALLGRLGYHVVASTGKPAAGDLLKDIGADRILSREELKGLDERPLSSARWSAAIDTVGGTTLAALLKSVGRHGCVASCGNAGGAELYTTVFPFILRGIKLVGIDSNTCPNEVRRIAWRRLAELLDKNTLSRISHRIGFDQLVDYSTRMLATENMGRIVVDVNE